MKRRAPQYAAGALVALWAVGSAVGAGAQPINTSTTTVQTTTVYDIQADRVNAWRSILDAGIDNGDIERVIWLIRDLRNLETAYRTDLYFLTEDMLTARTTSELNRAHQMSAEDAKRNFFARRDDIWRTIADRIGQSKADTLRAACEPKPDRTALYVPSEHMKRIDQLIAKWDEIHPGLVVATTTTTTTTTTTPGMAHRTFAVPMMPAPLNYSALVDLMEQKLAAYYGVEPAAWYFGSWFARDMSSPDSRYIRERAIRYWD